MNIKEDYTSDTIIKISKEVPKAIYNYCYEHNISLYNLWEEEFNQYISFETFENCLNNLEGKFIEIKPILIFFQRNINIYYKPSLNSTLNAEINI
jgi:hypothetical protein